jgi:hypothetical protein
MILKKIEFECLSDDINYSYCLKKRAKHVTNFINRTCLSQIRFESNTFQMIIIYLMENVVDLYVVNKGLIIPIPFSRNEYDSFNQDRAYRCYYYACIQKALDIAQNKYDLPKEKILNSLIEFKKQNFVNTWIHQQKKDTKRGIIATLSCILSIDSFELNFNVFIGDKLVINDIVLRTDPDEVAFDYRFKNIIIEDDRIIVNSKTMNILLVFFLHDYKLIVYDNE